MIFGKHLHIDWAPTTVLSWQAYWTESMRLNSCQPRRDGPSLHWGHSSSFTWCFGYLPSHKLMADFKKLLEKTMFGRSLAWVFFYTSMAENWRLVTSTSEGPKERVCSQNARHEFVLLQPELAASHLVCQPGGSATRPYCNSSVQWGARCTNLRHLTQASVVCMSGKTAQNNGGLTSSLT